MYKLLFGILFALLSCGENNTHPQNGENSENNSTNNVADGPSIRAPQEVLFSRVDPVTAETQNAAWEVIEVVNTGTEPLAIHKIEVAGLNSPYSVSYPAATSADPSSDTNVAPETVSAGESFFIRVYFNPTSRAYAESDLVIITNAADQPETRVQIKGNFGPCFTAALDVIDFGRVSPGESTTRTVTIENCSPDRALEISSVEIEGAVFRLVDSPGITPNGGVIPQNSSADVLVTFAPTERRSYEGELAVMFADETIVWPLAGLGELPCSKAHAQARIQDADGTSTHAFGDLVDTVPLTYIGFDSSLSNSPNGAIAEYEWTIVQKPASSTATLLPSNTDASPTLFVDTLGTFIVELRVVDELDVESCDDELTNRVTVNVGVVADIVVDLVWNTPDAPNQADTSGTDLDLHYLHPSGHWNTAPYNIFWRNRTADWGVPGPTDDPTLMLEDSDGAGPEIVSHNYPEIGLTYQVGVFYFADKGFGPSYATIRIFVGGTQRYEQRNEYLSGTGVFWHVASINWPTGQIISVNEKHQGFPGN